MIDRDYLKKLKKEDYIAWHDLTNDPLVIGNHANNGCGSLVLLIVVIILVIGNIIYTLM